MISDQSVIRKLENSFGFLSPENKVLYDRFIKSASIAHLGKGDYVCHEGRACSHLALVLEGNARVFKLGENGREITLYRVGQGESCILTASCILSERPFPAFAICETDVEAAVISSGDVKRWMAESSVWRDYVFGLVAHRLTNIINVVEEVVFQRMDRRIADYLYQHLIQGGSPVIHATHQEIASDLGTSREVVSRILKDFEHRSLIEVTRGSIRVMNSSALQVKSTES